MGKVATGRENLLGSDAHVHKGPYFLDIMAFYGITPQDPSYVGLAIYRFLYVNLRLYRFLYENLGVSKCRACFENNWVEYLKCSISYIE